MRIHHFNAATLCPLGGRFIGGTGGVLSRARMVCHCLLVELPDGLLLVDTGLGTDDLRHPRRRLDSDFVRLMRPRLDPAETALAKVKALGFSAFDVRHIALTHLDLDHAGGMSDFPEATVHLLRREQDAALAPESFLERRRYRPGQWSHDPRWATYVPSGEPWHGFECVRALTGLPPEVLLVPLIGHSRGHAGVAVRGDAGWVLHAGDAYFHRGEVHEPERRCPPLLDVFQRIMQIDGPARLHNQMRLRDLASAEGSELRIVCAHDPVELDGART